MTALSRLDQLRVVWEEMQQRVRRAADAGYNGIVFADRDENWYRGPNTKLWQNRLGELRTLTRTLGMQLLVACVPAKGGGTAEMAESFPVKGPPLVVSSDTLRHHGTPGVAVLSLLAP